MSPPGELVEDEAAVVEVARGMQVVAVLGIKDESEADAPAHTIPRLLANAGIRIIGVNPHVARALDAPVLKSVAELPAGVDILNVYRRPSAIPEHADELLALPPERRPKVVWLQSGIRHDQAAARLVAGGYRVIQDRCLGVYSRRAGRR